QGAAPQHGHHQDPPAARLREAGRVRPGRGGGGGVASRPPHLTPLAAPADIAWRTPSPKKRRTRRRAPTFDRCPQSIDSRVGSDSNFVVRSLLPFAGGVYPPTGYIWG